MVRFLISAAVFIASAAVGLLVASMLVDGMEITASGFIVTVLIFAAAQSILGPFILKMVNRHANAFLGGVGLISTFVALLIASTLRDSLSISGIGSWVAATVVVWLVTAVATLAIPFLLVKAGIQKVQEANNS